MRARDVLMRCLAFHSWPSPMLMADYLSTCNGLISSRIAWSLLTHSASPSPPIASRQLLETYPQTQRNSPASRTKGSKDQLLLLGAHNAGMWQAPMALLCLTPLSHQEPVTVQSYYCVSDSK